MRTAIECNRQMQMKFVKAKFIQVLPNKKLADDDDVGNDKARESITECKNFRESRLLS
jgi:hypothetical protein